MSTPGMAGDPCPQSGTECAAVNGQAITMCAPTMMWDRAGCTCVVPGASTCGNNLIDTGEQCDGANHNGMTCATMNMGGGTLSCDPTTCTLVTSMCTPGITTAAAGG